MSPLEQSLQAFIEQALESAMDRYLRTHPLPAANSITSGSERYLSVKEAADLCGHRNVKTIRKWYTKDGLPKHGTPRNILILLSELQAFLGKQQKPASSEDLTADELAAELLKKRLQKKDR